jgi:hypothetical protein
MLLCCRVSLPSQAFPLSAFDRCGRRLRMAASSRTMFKIWRRQSAGNEHNVPVLIRITGLTDQPLLPWPYCPAIYCVLWLLHLITAKATRQEVAAKEAIAIPKASQEAEAKVIEEFDRGALAIFHPRLRDSYSATSRFNSFCGKREWRLTPEWETMSKEVSNLTRPWLTLGGTWQRNAARRSMR